ncbi:MAG: M14 family zinc carboxypeptidase [Candidatus Aminicenantales bacterium]
MTKNAIRITAVLAGVFACAGFAAFAENEKPLPTPGEASAYREYTQNGSIAAFLSALAARTPELRVSVVGRTLPTDVYGARDIFLAVLGEKPAATPEALDRTKPTVLFTAAQHGNEQSAKEAVLWLLRDLAAGELRPLLKKVNVLAIPQTNPFGNFRNDRANELDLDMNRDHVKLEAEGVRAIHRVFRAWMPEVTIDVHEKGDDYYRVSIGCVSNANVAGGLQDFSRKIVLAEVAAALEKKNVAFHEYLVTEELGVDTSSGSARESGGAGQTEEMKRFSTTDLNDGRNGLGIFETLSFIQEGASRHDLETLRERTTWQYNGLRAFLESVAGHAPEILTMVDGQRARLLDRAEARTAGDVVHLRMKYVRDPAVPELVLKRFDEKAEPVRGILRIDKKAGETVTAADFVPHSEPSVAPVVDQVVKHWFPNVEPTLSVARPAGYIIKSDRLDIVETLLALGVEVGMFVRDGLMESEIYETAAIVPAKFDYDAPERIDVTVKAVNAPIKKGDFYISCVQPAANLVPCLLEPQSDYGFIRYGKFKLVPEAGGLFEILRYVGKESPAVIPYRRWRPL